MNRWLTNEGSISVRIVALTFAQMKCILKEIKRIFSTDRGAKFLN
jgi:hypothetical protein